MLTMLRLLPAIDPAHDPAITCASNPGLLSAADVAERPALVNASICNEPVACKPRPPCFRSLSDRRGGCGGAVAKDPLPSGVGPSEGGVARDRAVEFAECRRRIAVRFQEHREVVAVFGVVGLDRERPQEGGRRVMRAPEPRETDREVHPHVSVVGPEQDLSGTGANFVRNQLPSRICAM